MAQTIPANAFGDLALEGHNVIHAPTYTRIPLATIASGTALITVTEQAIVIAGQVSYRPIDLDHTAMAVVCQLVDDRRPLMVQAADRTAQGGGTPCSTNSRPARSAPSSTT